MQKSSSNKASAPEGRGASRLFFAASIAAGAIAAAAVAAGSQEGSRIAPMWLLCLLTALPFTAIGLRAREERAFAAVMQGIGALLTLLCLCLLAALAGERDGIFILNAAMTALIFVGQIFLLLCTFWQRADALIAERRLAVWLVFYAAVPTAVGIAYAVRMAAAGTLTLSPGWDAVAAAAIILGFAAYIAANLLLYLENRAEAGVLLKKPEGIPVRQKERCTRAQEEKCARLLGQCGSGFFVRHYEGLKLRSPADVSDEIGEADDPETKRARIVAAKDIFAEGLALTALRMVASDGGQSEETREGAFLRLIEETDSVPAITVKAPRREDEKTAAFFVEEEEAPDLPPPQFRLTLQTGDWWKGSNIKEGCAKIFRCAAPLAKNLFVPETLKGRTEKETLAWFLAPEDGIQGDKRCLISRDGSTITEEFSGKAKNAGAALQQGAKERLVFKRIRDFEGRYIAFLFLGVFRCRETVMPEGGPMRRIFIRTSDAFVL